MIRPSIHRLCASCFRSDCRHRVHRCNRADCDAGFAAARCAGVRDQLRAAARRHRDSGRFGHPAHHRAARRHHPRAHRSRQHASRRRIVGGAPGLAQQVRRSAADAGCDLGRLSHQVSRCSRRAQSASHRRARSRRQHHLRRRARPAHGVQPRRLLRLQGNARSTSASSDSATRPAPSTAATRPTPSGTPTTASKSRSIPSTRAFPSSSRSAADAATASFSTTPGAPGSTSASVRATPTPSAPKAVRSTTT